MFRARSLFLENMKASLTRMPNESRTIIRDGAFWTGVLTGAFAYFNYRIYLKKQFLRSEGHYRLNSQVKNCTPWKQMYFTWWRMPIEEWNFQHRFKPYFIIGQLDLSKEVLIPRSKTVNGKTVKGYDVLNPVYCYEGGRISMQDLITNAAKDPISIDRSAIIVCRGWIPAEFRDKRSRPQEAAQAKQLVKITGTWLRGKDIHDYKIPNNPDNNEWHNLCLEDIGLFWDLPNFEESKYYYFRAVDFGGQMCGVMSDVETPVRADNKDETIDHYYQWKLPEMANRAAMYSVGGISAVCWMAFATAVSLM